MTAWGSWFRKGRQTSPILTTITGTGCTGVLSIHIVTDTGNVRSNNEDCAAVVYPEDEGLRQEKGVMLVLADGMGGHHSGEVASKMAVERIAQVFFEGNGRPLERLKTAFSMVNTEIYEAGQTDGNKGMGTTCTAVVVLGDALYVAHVGDSRAYYLHHGQLTQLTIDQTYVQYLVQKGTINHHEAMKHPKRNMLMQALGASVSITPEMFKCEEQVAPDDVILLCSDGLYEYLSDEELASYLNADATLGTTAQDMVNEAKHRGGHDNITVLIGRGQPHRQGNASKATQEIPQDSTLNP